MGVYRNRAQKVFDHIKNDEGNDYLLKQFNLSVDRIEKTIAETVKRTGRNGFKVAEDIIKMWDVQKKTIDDSNE